MTADAQGEILKSGVRYLMMRPDVLMGVAHELPAREAALFLQALERSAFRNAQASFQQYRAQAQVSADELVGISLSMAAELGWGLWTVESGRDAAHEVRVENSPFASGFGRKSPFPVCGAITGVLKAILLVAYGAAVEVREVACAAQGTPACRFMFTGVNLSRSA